MHNNIGCPFAVVILSGIKTRCRTCSTRFDCHVTQPILQTLRTRSLTADHTELKTIFTTHTHANATVLLSQVGYTSAMHGRTVLSSIFTRNHELIKCLVYRCESGNVLRKATSPRCCFAALTSTGNLFPSGQEDCQQLFWLTPTSTGQAPLNSSLNGEDTFSTPVVFSVTLSTPVVFSMALLFCNTSTMFC